MAGEKKIITVGLCPCWDTVCRLDGINWGEHKQVASTESYPAGKAMNISRACAWMGKKNTAAGLWGKADYEQMSAALAPLHNKIEIKFTPAAGTTRENITIIDKKHKREMHLRAPSKLATKKSLRQLDKDLQRIATAKSVCVFSGSMPDKEFLPDVLSIMKRCHKRGAKIVVDTSGTAYQKIVAQGNLLLIKPNVAELRELTGKQIPDTISDLVKAARELLDKTEMVLISRGAKGAIVVSKDSVFEAQCTQKRTAVTTVACGDYLLAGFLAGFTKTGDMRFALETAIKSATARAWGLTKQNWSKIKTQIKVKLIEI
jgi:1-phosphofructokinase family hexose kinase